ncbi:HemK/PrmC family methyltransferase [Lachnospiraceae bacterium 62-35]
MTLQQLWEDGRKQLQRAGIRECDLDAKYLLLEAFDMDMAHFLVQRNDNLKSDDSKVIKDVACYLEWIEKRVKRIPLQYLTGKQEFMGLEFEVNEDVLIPRQDTETLAEWVISRCPEKKERKALRLLDMCTGSGCIGISLFVLGGFRNVTAVDVSLPALRTAYKNGRKCIRDGFSHKAVTAAHRKISDSPWKAESHWYADREKNILEGEFTWIESDLFQNLDKAFKYDIIVSNPPYIATGVIEGLEPEVKEYEPRLALDGNEDGLHFYRRLAEGGREYLAENGKIFLEIGYDQGNAVAGLLEENGFTDIEAAKDGAGLDRVIYGRRL